MNLNAIYTYQGNWYTSHYPEFEGHDILSIRLMI